MSADVKLAVILMVLSLTKVEVRNFPLLHYPRWLSLVICCSYKNSNDTVFSIFSNDQFYLKYYVVPPSRPADVIKESWKDELRVTSEGEQFWTSRTNAFSLLYFQFYFTKCLPESFKNYRFYSLGFWRHVPKTSYKSLKVTFRGWRCRDIPRASILSIITKCISVVNF